MITEDYCSYEVAKLLEEKGFEILTGKVYDNQNKLDYQNVVCWQEKRLPYISAPTHQMAMKWLREEHNIFIEVYKAKVGYICWIVDIPSNDGIKDLENDENNYTTYEDAIEAALKYALKKLI